MRPTILSTIVHELAVAAEQVDESRLVRLAEACEQASRLFVAGAGRSGFVARALANRLMHLGFDVSFVGEPTTPPIDAGDLLIVVSGSGRTTGLVALVRQARHVGAGIATVTLDAEAPIGAASGVCVVLPGTTRLAPGSGGPASIQPVGSLFEQLAWLTCDALVVLLRDRGGRTNDDLIARHANLE